MLKNVTWCKHAKDAGDKNEWEMRELIYLKKATIKVSYLEASCLFALCVMIYFKTKMELLSFKWMDQMVLISCFLMLWVSFVFSSFIWKFCFHSIRFSIVFVKSVNRLGEGSTRAKKNSSQKNFLHIGCEYNR